MTNFGWPSIALTPSSAEGMFSLDIDGDVLLLNRDNLEQLRAHLDQLLPRGEHNHEPSDPDAHVIFDSVCCGAQLYRCSAVLLGGLPAKPTIRHGENSCRDCGAVLLPF